MVHDSARILVSAGVLGVLVLAVGCGSSSKEDATSGLGGTGAAGMSNGGRATVQVGGAGSPSAGATAASGRGGSGTGGAGTGGSTMSGSGTGGSATGGADATGGTGGGHPSSGGSGGSATAGSGGLPPGGGTGGSSAGTSSSGGTSGSSGDCSLPALGETRPNGFVRLYAKTDFLNFVEPVGIDGDYAYFSEGVSAQSTLGRIALATAAVEQLGTVTGSPMVVHGGSVYFASTDATTSKTSLLSAPVDDPTTTIPLAQDVGSVQNLFADDQALYWSSNGTNGIWSVPLTGGTATDLASDGSTNGMILQGNDVYWLDFNSSYLERVPKTGGNTDKLVSIFFGGIMASDDQAIYWADGSEGTVNRWQLGASAATKLADLDILDDPEGIAADGGTVYYAVGFICGTVFKVSADGSNKTLLAQGFDSGGLIGVDATHLYITGDDGVFRVDR